jgi:ADP-heptose:LPS heptosyltransferase
LNRILVIRGGAIGDFVLTLPAIKLLRDRYPNARLEILGRKQVAVLAENRFYAEAIRSIDDPALARFFVRDAELSRDACDYFSGFDLILSYLFDPDQIFSGNLRRAGAERVMAATPKINDSEHAARQLARPLEEIGLRLQEAAARLFPNDEDRTAAARFPGELGSNFVAIHAGSGSTTKNWPIENWSRLLCALQSRNGPFLIIAGEADEARVAELQSKHQGQDLRLAKNLPLPHLAALLQKAIFFGHDSGISHLAAAAGAQCILLFGPSDPAIWAPANENVQVIRAPDGNLRALSAEDVEARVPGAVLGR